MVNRRYRRDWRGVKTKTGGVARHLGARGLQEELDGMLRNIDRMKDDGSLRPWEREVIERDLDRLYCHITCEKRGNATDRRR